MGCKWSARYADCYPLSKQAQKFRPGVEEAETDDELGEDSVLLESPLDKVEPYQLFRATLMSKFHVGSGLIQVRC